MNSVRRIKRHYRRLQKHPLTNEETYLALLRYLSLNIKMRFIDEQVVNWMGSLKLYLRKGDAGLVANFYYGLYEYEESLFLLHFLQEDDLFMDVGANLGHFSIVLSGIKKCNSIAIEPVPSTYNQLRRNIELNNLGNRIEAFQLGVGEKKDLLYLSTDRNTMDRIVTSTYKKSVKVPIKTIDEISECNVPVALKIDVEGYELFALKGAERVLSSSNLKVIILELNKSGEKYGIDDDSVYELLLNYGFKPFEYNVKTRKLVSLETYNTHKFNTIFIREITYVEERVANSEKIKIRKMEF